MPDRVMGSGLFADISGFTPLTEALVTEFGPRRGAEELTAVLDRVFDAVLGELHRYSGSVVYFSGDAVTCWLDGDDGTLAVACGLDMQRAMATVSRIITPGGQMFEMGMKVAVAAGKARRFVVGDPDVQLIEVLAGSLMDRLAATEQHAEPGDVVVEPSTFEAIADRFKPVVLRDAPGGPVAVVGGLRVPMGPLPPPAPYRSLPRSVVRQWLLPPVYERMRTGRGEFLAELRPALPMFVRFGGIDYDDDPDAPKVLDDFVRRVQWVVDGHGGNLLGLTVGDKGAYLYAVFGSPLAHEDDAARACAAALDLLAMEAETTARDLQIGVSSGRVRSGTTGHRHRRAFSCLGDPVNLAARLMSAAPPGTAVVTAEVARAAGPRFSFEVLPDFKAKGKSQLISVRRLAGLTRGAAHRAQRPVHPLVGRTGELVQLRELAELALAGRGQVVALEAEAGMGKSRLVSELLGFLGAQRIPAHIGAATSVGSATSYVAWQSIWASLLGMTAEGDPVPEIEQALTAADEALLPRLPLLGAVLGTRIEDNELTASLDPKRRKSALESLLMRYLTVRAGHGPVVLLLEDCHWLDSLSADLLDLVARQAGGLQILVVLTYRPGKYAAPKLRHTTVLRLQGLDAGSSRALLSERLLDQFGPGVKPPSSLLRRLVERSEGNPFFMEELVNYLHGEGIDPSDPKAATVDLPDSLASLVLSRIDELGESSRRTLKVASVVGRQFGVDVLTGAYPDLGIRRSVIGHLQRLCAADLVVQEGARDDGDGYAFRHAVIGEVAYESIPFSMRSLLHGRIGGWFERTSPDALDLLAHHFWHSAEEDKKREYLRRAGEAAEARYANDAAIDYYQRLAGLLGEEERGEVLRKLGSVRELGGDWAGSEAAYGQALALAEALGDRGAAAWSRVGRSVATRRQGRYGEAAADLDAAARDFQAIGDTPGMARVAHVRGVVAYQRGELDEAWEQLQLSLELWKAVGDREAEARVLDSLAVTAIYQENYELGADLGEQVLDLWSTLGHRWGVGISHLNLGVHALLRKDYTLASSHEEQALGILLETGDTYAVANVRHNLGDIARETGDRNSAGEHYTASLEMFRDLGDRRSLCMVYEAVALLLAGSAPLDALRLVGAADALRQAIGSPRSTADGARIDEQLGEARRRLDGAAMEAEVEGRALALDVALELALQLCGNSNTLI
jgi:class 3 adenylate cyclase/tetratricopeptide (TPR) repeat protein